VIRVNEPYFVLLFPYIRPKLVYFQAVIAFFLRLYRINPRSKDFEYLRDAYFEDGAGVPYTNSAYQHDFYEFCYTGEATPVSFFMVCNKLTSAVFAEIILGAVAFFSVFDYSIAMALGAFEFYGDLHYSIISLLSSFVMLRLSYFVDHHLPFFFKKAKYFFSGFSFFSVLPECKGPAIAYS
jgi:hypothetical protein